MHRPRWQLWVAIAIAILVMLFISLVRPSPLFIG